MSYKIATKWNCIYELNSDNKILSSLIKKVWCKCTFLNHFREANEQLLSALLLPCSDYKDYKSSFNELLDKDSSFTIHQKNVQSLAIEIYKCLHGLSPTILGEVSIYRTSFLIPYDLRMPNESYARIPKTVKYGT